MKFLFVSKTKTKKKVKVKDLSLGMCRLLRAILTILIFQLHFHILIFT